MHANPSIPIANEPPPSSATAAARREDLGATALVAALFGRRFASTTHGIDGFGEIGPHRTRDPLTLEEALLGNSPSGAKPAHAARPPLVRRPKV